MDAHGSSATPPSEHDAAAAAAPTSVRASDLASESAAWLRQLSRAAKISRLYRVGNPVAEEARRKLWEKLGELTRDHGAFSLRFTPSEIYLGDEVVVSSDHKSDDESFLSKGGEEQMPMLFYGDGIRAITFTTQVPRGEVEALVDALRDVGLGGDRHEDLVTLLWQANLSSIRVTSAPPEQTIYHSTHAASGPNPNQGHAHVLAPTGSELRAELGQGSGAQGLHRDRFDDRILPDFDSDVITTYADLEISAEASRAQVLQAWEVEILSDDDPVEVARFLKSLVELDDGAEMREAIAHLAIGWLPAAITRGAWDEARRAHELLREVLRGDAAREAIVEALRRVDPKPLAERLEKSERGELETFLSLAMEIGAPASALVSDMMAVAEEPATRAAAEVTLATLCAIEPNRLASYLLDPRWYVVRNAAHVLGMIGGTGIAEMLRPALMHPDPRVVKEAIRSLARTPREESTPILIELLETRNPQMLATVLSVVTREKTPEVTRALLARIGAGSFESQAEDLQRSTFSALAEIADDDAVPALSALVQKGGLFVRRTFTRMAAARTLARIGTPAARGALEAGLKSKHEAIRAICREALGRTE